MSILVPDRIRWHAFLPWRTVEPLSGNLLGDSTALDRRHRGEDGAWLDRRGILGIADTLLPAVATIGIVLYAAMLHVDFDMRDAGLPHFCTVPS